MEWIPEVVLGLLNRYKMVGIVRDQSIVPDREHFRISALGLLVSFTELLR